MTTDQKLRDILQSAEVIAVVGASQNPSRPSHFVSLDLVARGKRVIPVNPGLAGQELFGEPVWASLADIPKDIAVDMVDIFRRSDQVLPIVEEAIAELSDLRVIWMQLGVESLEARLLAEAKGLEVVENRCPKAEFPRLFEA